MPPSIGMRFGRYELLARLGVGGMGEVWRARDADLQRDVAVKFLPERFVSDPQRLSRFAQEARAASCLNHPNIVTIHEIGEAQGQPYIVMELVDGRSLHDLGHEAPLPARALLEIGVQVADGLAKAHAAGIVHRDLKPDNVMVTDDGFAKILDFGLAKLRGENGGQEQWFDSHAPASGAAPASPVPQTATGVVLGTLGYMSPEQARGRPVDQRSDQFTFGTILYELATGRPAFRRESPPETLMAIIEQRPEPIAAFNPSLPEAFRDLIEERCLAKDPARRYESTADLARELRALRDRLASGASLLPLDATRSLAQVVTRASSTRILLSRRRVLATAAVAILATAAIWATWRSRRPAPDDPTRPPVVAVLPLTTLTGEPADEAAAAGITEVVIASLTHLPEVQVLSRLATVQYKDRKADLATVARELDATYILDGTLQRSQSELRVNLTLVRAMSRVVAWSGTYDGAFPRMFDLQTRVADGVAGALRLSVPPEVRQLIEAPPTKVPQAWRAYSEALTLIERADKPGHVDRAAALLREALAADSRFARAHGFLAWVLWLRYEATREARWADEARDASQEALRLDAQDGAVRLVLARVLAGRGRLPEALEEVEHVRGAQPNSDEASRLLAKLLADAGRSEAALQEAQRAVSLRPAFAENHTVLGYVRFKAGHFAAAAQEYRRASDLQPDNARTTHMLATSLHMAGDLAGALAAYRRTLVQNPAPQAAARSWSNIGTIHYARGELADAVRAYREASRLEPASSTVRRSLGDALARSGDAAGARAAWKESARLSRDTLRVKADDVKELKNLGLCQAKLGQRAAALGTVERALRSGPQSSDAHYGAAAVLAILGQPARARSRLEQALRLGASVAYAASDTDLAALHGTPEFQALLRRFEAKDHD